MEAEFSKVPTAAVSVQPEKPKALKLTFKEKIALENVLVVVDDLAMDVDQVVRGDDLLSSSPRQAWLAAQLGGSAPMYAHVPLAVNAEGRRLAKRDGAVTLADHAASGVSPDQVLTRIAGSLGLAEPDEPVSLPKLLARFDPSALPRTPWVVA